MYIYDNTTTNTNIKLLYFDENKGLTSDKKLYEYLNASGHNNFETGQNPCPKSHSFDQRPFSSTLP